MRATFSPLRVVLTSTFLMATFALAACAERPAADEEVTADDAAMTAQADETMDESMAGDQDDDPMAGEYMLGEGRRAVVEDGEYTVYGEEDAVLVEGMYTYRGDTVVFVDQGGPMACGSDVQGVYVLATDATGEPDLALVEDACEGRRRDITGEGEDGS